ncbi:MAG: acetylornithine deacetylase [Alphaproteobacteria bacterium]
MVDSALQELEKLVAFDTVSRNSNLALINYAADLLKNAGAHVELLPNAAGDKANLLATLGPRDVPGGIVLSGHTDVVPVDGQPWDSDPFQLVRKGDKVYGRGTSDMKGFIACALAAARNVRAETLAKPLHFAFSYDEEVGCEGCLDMVARLAGHLPTPALCLVGEPTEMKVVNAHKGIAAFATTVTGHEAHSSRTHAGINAVSYAAQLVAALDDLAQEMRAKGDPSGRFDPPFTSVHIGRFTGGTALNIIPRRAVIDWEIRALPSQNVGELVAMFEGAAKKVDAAMLARVAASRALGEDVADDVGVSTQPGALVPGLAPHPISDAETLAMKLAGQNEVHAVSYGTEAGHFQQAGVPTIVCGPGSIAQAHKPNEFIAISELAATMQLLDRVGEYLRRA